MPPNAVIIDAATRFLRTNPEVLELARRGAGESGVAVEFLLTDAVRRIRRSGFEAVAQKQVVAASAGRLERSRAQRVRPGRPGLDQPGRGWS